jgi:hypothetical protein
MRNVSVYVFVELAILAFVLLLKFRKLAGWTSIENDELFLENGEGRRWWWAVVKV